MLKRLRNRLTLLAACLTGSVVVAVCIISFILIRNQYANSRYTAFQLAAESVATQWELEGDISTEWLAANIEANVANAVLWENNLPMDHHLVDVETARRLKDAAPAAEIVGEPVYYEYGSFICAWFDLSHGYGQREILVWQDTEPERDYFLKIGLVFAVIALVSLAVVTWLCYLVAGKAIVPVQEAMERQERFVAAASHELRSPLTVLRTGFGVIKQSPEQSERYLGLMEGETNRMTRLVDELLILAGGGSLRKNFRPRPIELDTVLIDFVDSMTPVAEKKGIFLEICLPEETIPAVSADEDRVKQILSILVDNALRYAPEKSTVHTSLEKQSKGCVLSVIDHGPGIPDSEKKKVFDRFYRGSQSRSDPNHFGLGLAVAQELAAIHGGNLWLADTPGGGATFKVMLPY